MSRTTSTKSDILHLNMEVYGTDSVGVRPLVDDRGTAAGLSLHEITRNIFELWLQVFADFSEMWFDFDGLLIKLFQET